MSPTITKNLKPRKVSRPKKAFKQKKIPKSLRGIGFAHYGVRLADMNDVTMMQTTISPSAASRSNASSMSSHAMTSSQDSVPASADPVSQIPVSAPTPMYPDNAHYGIEIPNFLTTGFPPAQSLLGNEGFEFHSQLDGIPSTASNSWQSYGRSNHQLETNGFVLPPRSSVSLGFDDDTSLRVHPDIQHPTMSYTTNMPSMTFTSAAYDDVTHYIETGRYPYLITMPNVGADFNPFEPFLNNDARYNPYRYM